jgi:hypothetical protein
MGKWVPLNATFYNDVAAFLQQPGAYRHEGCRGLICIPIRACLSLYRILSAVNIFDGEANKLYLVAAAPSPTASPGDTQRRCKPLVSGCHASMSFSRMAIKVSSDWLVTRSFCLTL